MRLRRRTLAAAAGVGLYVAWRRREELHELCSSAWQTLNAQVHSDDAGPVDTQVDATLLADATPTPIMNAGAAATRRPRFKRAGLFVRAAVRIQVAWRRRLNRLRFLSTSSAAAVDELALHSRLVWADDGSPGQLEMDVSLNVMSVHSIDTVEQRFSCEFVLRLRTLNAAMLRTTGGREPVGHENWE